MGVSLTELGKSNHHKHLLYSRFPKDNSAKLQSKRLKIFLLSGIFLTIQPGFATDPILGQCKKAVVNFWDLGIDGRIVNWIREV